MPANLLRLTARGDWGLYEDTLFIISWIETSLLAANLPHNSNKKMDPCFCCASKADDNNGRSINQICAQPYNNLLILFLLPCPLIHLSDPTYLVLHSSTPPPPSPSSFNWLKRMILGVGSKWNRHHSDSKSHTNPEPTNTPIDMGLETGWGRKSTGKAVNFND